MSTEKPEVEWTTAPYAQLTLCWRGVSITVEADASGKIPRVWLNDEDGKYALDKDGKQSHLAGDRPALVVRNGG